MRGTRLTSTRYLLRNLPVPDDGQAAGIGVSAVIVVGEIFAEADGAHADGLQAFQEHDAVDAVHAEDQPHVRPDGAGGALDEGGEDARARAEQHIAGAELRAKLAVGRGREFGKFVAEEGHGGEDKKCGALNIPPGLRIF